MGSSPHTRGAPAEGRKYQQDKGIIPAYAGSTVRDGNNLLGNTDHPRIRGEHMTAHSSGAAAFGSSPHTRGAPQGTFVFPLLRGIIPAYAGST